MPSCNAATLQAMAEQLAAAAAAQDWSRLQRLDAALLHWLRHEPQAIAQSAWGPQWQQVRAAHAQAAQACVAAKAVVAGQMADLTTSCEAQKAYAWQEVLK